MYSATRGERSHGRESGPELKKNRKQKPQKKKKVGGKVNPESKVSKETAVSGRVDTFLLVTELRGRRRMTRGIFTRGVFEVLVGGDSKPSVVSEIIYKVRRG